METKNTLFLVTTIYTTIYQHIVINYLDYLFIAETDKMEIHKRMEIQKCTARYVHHYFYDTLLNPNTTNTSIIIAMEINRIMSKSCPAI